MEDLTKMQILYVEDDAPSGRLVKSIAQTAGFNVQVVGTGKEFLLALGSEKPDVLMLDLNLPDANGLDLLAKARQRIPDTPVVVVTASNAVDDVVKALKGGATDYLSKPLDYQRLIVSLSNAVKLSSNQQELSRLRSEIGQRYKLEHILGMSESIKQVRDMVEHAARRDATVLINGESGTGKELIAKALHFASHRAAKPFVDVNCAALTETLIESELFGHEKGAFTGAIARRRGKFEQAHGGSLFLDEIGDMPLSTQAKMLRVLQERSFQRVGGEEKLVVDVRVICATNKNLEECVAAGTFRLDLLYRINPLVIEVPPLRDRRADVPQLVNHFLSTAIHQGSGQAQSVSDAAMNALQNHRWPGNVRELQNAIERALMLCDSEEIQVCHLPPAILRSSSMAPAPSANKNTTSINLIESLEQHERSIIVFELQKQNWNQTKTAAALGVTRRMLVYKMHNLGIERPSTETYEH